MRIISISGVHASTRLTRCALFSSNNCQSPIKSSRILICGQSTINTVKNKEEMVLNRMADSKIQKLSSGPCLEARGSRI